MSGTTTKIQRVRTFQSDIASAKGSVPENPPAVMTMNRAPRVTLPPVLNEKKPEPTPPPVHIPPAATPTTDTSVSNQAVSSALAAQPVAGGASNTISETSGNTSLDGKKENLIKTLPVIPTYEPVRVTGITDDTESRGTVITDQKHKRFKLLPAIWQALTQWFEKTENKIQQRAEAKRSSVPTVRSAEDRKETIQKAATVSAISPKDDHAKLTENLPPVLKREIPIPQTPVVITKKESVPAPSWSHFDVMSSERNATSAADTAPRAPVVKVPATPVVPPPPAVPQPDPSAKNVEERVMVEPITVDIGRRPPPVVTAKRAPTRSRRNFRWLFYVGVTATAIVAAVSGVALMNWLLRAPSTTVTPIATTDLPATFVTPVPQAPVVKIPLTRTRAEWYAAVSQATGSDTITIVPVINIGGAESQVATEDILAMLALRVEPALTRSIKDMTFMKSAGKPVIVLKVASYDSSFGGLLLSENRLSTELEPLFGSVVTATYKPGTGTVPPEFVDELADNHDVRVLKDEVETERLVYGFANQSTVIIAPDKETFASIASLLR